MTKKIIIKKDYGSYVEGFLFDSTLCGGHGNSCPHCSQKKGRPIKALKRKDEKMKQGSLVTIISGRRELFYSLLFLLIFPLAIGFEMSTMVTPLAGIIGGILTLVVFTALSPLLRKLTWPHVESYSA